MKNEYENETFFAQYAQMPRSKEGLSAAGEWHQLQRLMPELRGKRVLDLGCGYGWHCKYATDQGAAEVLGIDMSPKMLEEALRRNRDDRLRYRVCGVEEYEYPRETWDVVLSNLTLHYVADLEAVFRTVYRGDCWRPALYWRRWRRPSHLIP